MANKKSVKKAAKKAAKKATQGAQASSNSAGQQQQARAGSPDTSAKANSRASFLQQQAAVGAPSASAQEKAASQPKEIWVKRNKENFVTICFIGELKIRVNPGVNRIKDPDILACIADEKLNMGWKAFLSNRTHELISGREEKSQEATTVFTAMAPDNALDLIKETYSVPALEIMYADEESKKARPIILNALLGQIQKMKTPDTKEQANA